MIMHKLDVMYNQTYGAWSGDIGFISADGDLSIAKIIWVHTFAVRNCIIDICISAVFGHAIFVKI